MQWSALLFVRGTSLQSSVSLCALILAYSSKDLGSLNSLSKQSQSEECHTIFVLSLSFASVLWDVLVVLKGAKKVIIETKLNSHSPGMVGKKKKSPNGALTIREQGLKCIFNRTPFVWTQAIFFFPRNAVSIFFHHIYHLQPPCVLLRTKVTFPRPNKVMVNIIFPSHYHSWVRVMMFVSLWCSPFYLVHYL